jgi:hypothetical protein
VFFIGNVKSLNAWRGKSRNFRFWMDDWYSYFENTTHSLLRFRQNSISDLNSIVNLCNFSRDTTLSKVLKREVASHINQINRLGICPRSISVEPDIDDINSKNTREWLNIISMVGHQEDIGYICARRLDFVISQPNPKFDEIRQLNRILGSILFDKIKDKNEILLNTYRKFLTDKEFSVCRLVDDLYKIREVSERFQVTYNFFPVDVTKKNMKTGLSDHLVSFSYNIDPSYDENNPHDKKSLLTGIRIRDISFSPYDAVLDTFEKCRAVLNFIRVTALYNTALQGAIKVESLDRNFSRFYALRRPFWKSNEKNIRDSPSLPNNFLNNIDDRENPDLNWDLSLHHFARAVAIWPEDVHAAASSVWQALESLFGKGNILEGVRDRYLEKYKSDVRRHYWHRLKIQSNRFIKFGGCDWSFPEEGQIENIQMSKKYVYESRNWKFPTVNDYCMHEEFGILYKLYDDHGIVDFDKMTMIRLKNDLNFLASIRHAFVHRGERIGSSEWVEYLANMGIEIFLYMSK